jgi:apolipoprotein N-acyltransferase
MRRGHEPFPVGPRVALIQGNFVATVRNDQHEPREIFMSHRQLTGMVVGERPDVVVWPEGMFPYGIFLAEQGITDDQLQKTSPDVPVNLWRNEEAQQALSDLTDMTNAAMIVGAAVYTAGPLEYALYNSAVFLQPGIGLVNRYDKIHRVPFGEYIPLHDMLPFLQKFTPFRGQFGIDRGKEAHVFRYRDWQLIPIICFEDTVPHLVRRIASVAGINGAEQSQCLVNLTNDGWFHGSSALDQHLITSLFRAVEVRAPLVRAVNTGISAVIDGDGVIRDPDVFFEGVTSKGSSERVQSFRDPKTGRFHKQISCALVADVPLDPRTSLYVMIGDTFALLCLTASVAILLSSLFLRPAPVRSGPESLVPSA